MRKERKEGASCISIHTAQPESQRSIRQQSSGCARTCALPYVASCSSEIFWLRIASRTSMESPILDINVARLVGGFTFSVLVAGFAQSLLLAWALAEEVRTCLAAAATNMKPSSSSICFRSSDSLPLRQLARWVATHPPNCGLSLYLEGIETCPNLALNLGSFLSANNRSSRDNSDQNKTCRPAYLPSSA